MGAVENVYASLVVLLGYTSVFTRVKQWRNDAHYVVGDDQLLCGFRAESEREGELQFVLYFDERVRERERRMFQDMFESLLARRELTVLRFDPVICSNGHRLNRSVVQDELASGNEAAFCTRCGERLQLAGALSRPRLTVQAVDALAPENRTADTRTRFEEVLFKLKAHVDQAGTAAPDCFISYAWGRPEHERWVERQLATDLQKCGIGVILDRWDNARIGASVPRFIERAAKADRVVVVGTPEYRRKYDNEESMGGYAVGAEGDLIGQRMLGGERDKQQVLPVLLEGEPQHALPELLRPRVYADFRSASSYFSTMLGLMLSLYGMDPRGAVADELRNMLDDPAARA